jgi:hypothetical protein
MLKVGYFGKQLRNTLEVLKCGAGGLMSFGLIMGEISIYGGE